MPPEPTIRKFGPFRHEARSLRVTGPHGTTPLTDKEDAVLTLFLDRRGQQTSVADFVKAAWGETNVELSGARNRFDQCLKKLRTKLDKELFESDNAGHYYLNEDWMAPREQPKGPDLPDSQSDLGPRDLFKMLDVRSGLGLRARQRLVVEAIHPIEVFEDGFHILRRNAIDHGVRCDFRFNAGDPVSAASFVCAMLTRLEFVDGNGQDLDIGGMGELVKRVSVILTPSVHRHLNMYVINADHAVGASRIVSSLDYSVNTIYEKGAAASLIGSALMEPSHGGTLVRVGNEVRSREPLRLFEEALKDELPQISGNCRRMIMGDEWNQRPLEMVRS